MCLAAGAGKRHLRLARAGQERVGTAPPEISALTYPRSRNAIGVFLIPQTAYLLNARTLEGPGDFFAEVPYVGAVCDMPHGPGYIATTSIDALDAGASLFKADDGSIASSIRFRGHIQALRYSTAAQRLAVGFRDGGIETCDAEDLLGSGHLKSTADLCS